MHGNRLLAFAGLALSLALVGCGSDTGTDGSPTDAEASTSTLPSPVPASDTPSESSTPTPDPGATTQPPPGDAPDCAEVWKQGAKIPRSYLGCVDTDGAYVERDTLDCSSGQRLARFDDTYYGVLGGSVILADTTPLSDDPAYRRVVRGCRA